MGPRLGRKEPGWLTPAAPGRGRSPSARCSAWRSARRRRRQEQHDDADPACDRDLVTLETAPDELPVAAGATASISRPSRLRPVKDPRPDRPEPTISVVSRWSHRESELTALEASYLRYADCTEPREVSHYVSVRCVGARDNLEDLLGDLRLAGSVHRSVRRSMSSPAFLEAFLMAVIRAPSTDAADSRSAR